MPLLLLHLLEHSFLLYAHKRPTLLLSKLEPKLSDPLSFLRVRVMPKAVILCVVVVHMLDDRRMVMSIAVAGWDDSLGACVAAVSMVVVVLATGNRGHRACCR